MEIRWKLDKHMREMGWKNAHQLATGTRLSYPVASRLLEDKLVERIDVATLDRLCFAFKCGPWDVLDVKGTYEPRRR